MLRGIRLFLFFAVSLAGASFLRGAERAVSRSGRVRFKAAVQASWARAVRRILGLHVDVRGECPSGGPFLVVSNHLGYLDIPILAGILPPVSFVSKAEVGRWPLIGSMARAAGTVFVSREVRTEVRDFVRQVRSSMNAGENVVVFPEGTSSRGEIVLPFKTAAFAPVSGMPGAMILPVRIELLEVGGAPASGRVRDIACWHGDMKFAPHFWSFLASGGARFRVGIGQAIGCESSDRKALSRIAHDRVDALGKENGWPKRVPIRSRENI